MISGVDRLGDELGVLRQPRIPALCGEARRLEAQEDHDFVFDVEMRVIVVAKFGRCRAIAGKHHGAGCVTGSGKTEGNEILIQFQCLLRFSVFHFQAIACFQFCAGNNGERLEKRFGPRRLQPQGQVALLDHVRGALDALGPRPAAFHCWSRKRFDVIQVPLGVGGISIGRYANGNKNKRKRQTGCAPARGTSCRAYDGAIHSNEIKEGHVTFRIVCRGCTGVKYAPRAGRASGVSRWRQRQSGDWRSRARNPLSSGH